MRLKSTVVGGSGASAAGPALPSVHYALPDVSNLAPCPPATSNRSRRLVTRALTQSAAIEPAGMYGLVFLGQLSDYRPTHRIFCERCYGGSILRMLFFTSCEGASACMPCGRAFQLAIPETFEPPHVSDEQPLRSVRKTNYFAEDTTRRSVEGAEPQVCSTSEARSDGEKLHKAEQEIPSFSFSDSIAEMTGVCKVLGPGSSVGRATDF